RDHIDAEGVRPFRQALEDGRQLDDLRSGTDDREDALWSCVAHAVRWNGSHGGKSTARDPFETRAAQRGGGAPTGSRAGRTGARALSGAAVLGLAGPRKDPSALTNLPSSDHRAFASSRAPAAFRATAGPHTAATGRTDHVPR